MREHRDTDANSSEAQAWSHAAAGKATRTEHLPRSTGTAAGSDVVQLKSEGAGGDAAANDAFGVHLAPRPMLTVGARGQPVVELQEKLGVDADGVFGPKTRAAVIAFQQRHGLGADGVVGAKTWAALDGGPVAPATQAAAKDAAAEAPASTPASAPASASAQAPASTSAPAAANAAAPAESETPAATGNPARAAIVAAARSKLGLIASNQSGGADETGEKVRMGWEHLTEVFGVACPAFPPQIIKYLKYGKNSDASNPNGLPSWCGIFATWAVMTGGGNCGGWQSGNRVDNMAKLTKDPRPGDVGNFEKNNHYCIIAAVNGDTIETIDGNSFDGATGGDGSVATKTRSRGEFRAFFRQVDD